MDRDLQLLEATYVLDENQYSTKLLQEFREFS
jgi:hypothetical protein